jgi:hypothetical protein
MNATKKMCAGMETKLADLLLDPETVPATVKTHVAGCETCSREMEELRATMAMLDTWEAPEPNPYFMTRFEARLHDEKQAAPAGWFERLKARLAFGPQMHVRPLAAMSMMVVVLLGGGTYLDVYWEQPTAAPAQTAVVHDLQTLDNNAQLLDQLESISTDQDQDQN